MRPQLMERSEHKLRAEWDPTPSGRMYYVYILRDRHTLALYYGYTNNLPHRLVEHVKDGNPELVYYEAYKAEADARRRERQLKHYAQALTVLKDRIKESIR